MARCSGGCDRAERQSTPSEHSRFRDPQGEAAMLARNVPRIQGLGSEAVRLWTLRALDGVRIGNGGASDPWAPDERSEEKGALSALVAPPSGARGACPPQAPNVRQWVRVRGVMAEPWRCSPAARCELRTLCGGAGEPRFHRGGCDASRRVPVASRPWLQKRAIDAQRASGGLWKAKTR